MVHSTQKGFEVSQCFGPIKCDLIRLFYGLLNPGVTNEQKSNLE